MRKKITLVLITIATILFNCAISRAEKIEELFLNNDYPAVIDEAGSILSKGTNQPNADKVYYYLGLSNIRLGNFSEARNDLNILLRDFTNSKFKDRASLAIADSFFLEENYLEAKNTYEKLAKNSGSDILSLVYYKLSQTNMKLGNWQEAKDCLEKLKNEFPQSFEASLARTINVSEEYFTVQVGSFLNKEKAKMTASELKSSGFDSYIAETISQGKTFYRVRVGKLSSLNEAKELEKQLTGKNYPTKIFP